MKKPEKQWDYAYEKMSSVCFGLAIGEGDARSRLANNFETLCRLNSLIDLPPALGPRLDEIVKTLTAQPPLLRPDGAVLRASVQQTTRKMTNRTAARIAREIVELNSDLIRHRAGGG